MHVASISSDVPASPDILPVYSTKYVVIKIVNVL